MTTLNHYWKMLRAHDWHYDFSDDINTYRRGRDSENLLAQVSWESKEHQKLWDGFQNHYKDIVKGIDSPAALPAEPKE